jgi:hypothetical protein
VTVQRFYWSTQRRTSNCKNTDNVTMSQNRLIHTDKKLSFLNANVMILSVLK